MAPTPQDPRTRYLDLAAEAFAAAGFHGVSLAMLAKEAGVSKQALLHFFGTKERLYSEVLARLSDRLLAKLRDLNGPPEARLAQYFDAHASGALARPTDARLVVRALLDSDAKARVWPLRPYLEALIALARETDRWRDAPDEEVLAGLYQLIGAIQYFSISAPTLSGMFGSEGHQNMETAFAANLRRAVDAFLK